MTGPSAPRHLDLDELADVLAGVRTGDRHLATCDDCTHRLAELAEAEVAVAAALALLPAPALPEGLSERLAEVARTRTAEEQAASDGHTASAGPAATSGGAWHAAADGAGARDPDSPRTLRSAGVVPLRRRRQAPWLPAAAAVLALVVAGGLGLGALQGRGPGTATSESAAGGSAQDASTQDPTSPEGAAQEGTARALAQGSAQAQVEALTLRALSTGTDYAVGPERDAALSALLSATAVPSAPRTEGSAPPDLPHDAQGEVGRVLDRLRDPAALRECLDAARAGGSPAATPLGLDYAAYDGSPALAVLQPDRDPAVLVLTVVGPGCSAADPDTRVRRRVARP